MFGEEILLEIDSTLDQLILNAETIGTIEIESLNETEIDAFQKTQESLLQHLLHMDQFMAQKRSELKVPKKESAQVKIQEKLQRFEKLKINYSQHLVAKRSILAKRRNKKILVLR